RVRERMDQLGHSPSRIKDATGLAGGLGMLLFARSQPDTPGKLAAHAYSYEHMEIAAYGILAAYADRSGDRETAELARRIESEERAMAGRISERFGEAVSAALIGRTTTLDRLLARYVANLHAIEAQGRQLCARTMGMVDHPELAGILNRQLRDGWVQQAVWKRDLEDLGDGPSTLKDLPLALGGNFVATFLLAQPDPNTKVAGFAFAFQNLLAGSCEMLERVARLAGEDTIAAQAESRAAAVRNSANRISKLWEQLGGV
ncbi:MAG TPA: DUF892 family protein, partial [Solirubrobacterales bacterium]|nr:DUF892 family protein [Solirubrobacterales bacterium]